MSRSRTQVVHITARVHAPIERLWALSTRVELVQKTLGMRIADGVKQGYVTGGSRVVWKGWKFGLPTEHHTLITGYAAPQRAATQSTLHAEVPDQPVAWFQDSQEQGRFAAFHHDHWLRQNDDAEDPMTTLEDEVHFSLPFGALGALVARWIMVPFVKRLVKQRFARLKSLAEGDGWKQWV